MFISLITSSLLLALILPLAYAYPQDLDNRGNIVTREQVSITKDPPSTSNDINETVDIGFGTIENTTAAQTTQQTVSGFANQQTSNTSDFTPPEEISLDTFMVGVPPDHAWMEIYDYATAVPTCFTVCQSPLFKGKLPIPPLDVWQPCDQSTYQWRLVNYTNAMNFRVRLAHALRNVTTSQVWLKTLELSMKFLNGTQYPNGTQDFSNFNYSSGPFPGTYKPAPAGWKGDDALNSLGG